MKRLKKLLVGLAVPIGLILSGCSNGEQSADPIGTGKKMVVCTTTMIHDIGKVLAGDLLDLRGIMKAGEDPHIYELKPHDTKLIIEADLILMNGLHLEAQVGHVIEEKARGRVSRLAEDPRIVTLGSEDAAGAPDPHCWFNPEYFKIYVEKARDALSGIDPDNVETYNNRAKAYMKELDELFAWGKKVVAAIPREQRIMVTSHDAFQYFGKAFDIEVYAVAGISTEQDPAPQDRLKLETVVKERGAKALFVETSVRDALNNMIQQIAKSSGAKIGGTLYSDSLGEPGSVADTYIHMMKHNLSTLADTLK